MTGPVAASGIRFSQVLRDSTFSDHRDAQGAGFVHSLMSGGLPVSAYADLAAQQWFVYTELERLADLHAADPVAGAFVHPELTRVPVIEADLEALLGADWRSQVRSLPATDAYVDRLRSVAEEWVPGFVAHHYTRYMGDLSGGVHIGRAVDRSYGFEGGPGARFYVFDQIPDADAFKEAYRTALDEAPWSDGVRDDVVAEVRVAYQCNTDVIGDLAKVHVPEG